MTNTNPTRQRGIIPVWDSFVSVIERAWGWTQARVWTLAAVFALLVAAWMAVHAATTPSEALPALVVAGINLACAAYLFAPTKATGGMQ